MHLALFVIATWSRLDSINPGMHPVVMSWRPRRCAETWQQSLMTAETAIRICRRLSKYVPHAHVLSPFLFPCNSLLIPTIPLHSHAPAAGSRFATKGPEDPAVVFSVHLVACASGNRFSPTSGRR